MTKPRSNKARKVQASQDVSMSNDDAKKPQRKSISELVQEQQYIEHMLYQLLQQKGHLFVLLQQDKGAEYLHALTANHRAHFLNALSTTPSQYWLPLAQQQRNEYSHALAQHQQYREYLYACAAQQQNQQQFGQQASDFEDYTAPVQQQSYQQQDQKQAMLNQNSQAPISMLCQAAQGQAASEYQRAQATTIPSAPTSATMIPSTAPTSAPPPTVPMDPFEILGQDIHRHVFSYLLCLRDGHAERPKSAVQFYTEANRDSYQANHPEMVRWTVDRKLETQFASLSSEQSAMWNALEQRDLERYHKQEASFTRPHDLAKTCKTLSLVSKYWRVVTGEVVCSNAPAEILSKRDLFRLKARVRMISLETGKHFIKNLQEKWGKTTLEMYGIEDTSDGALDTVIQCFGGSQEAFADLVANEYRQFLVVKAVESIAVRKYYDDSSTISELAAISAWKEKCQPSLLVDMFWHAHMQAPQKYAADCHLLIGDLVSNGTDFSIGCIIDHDAGYVSSNAYAGSDYTSKHNMLFSFEKQLPGKDFFGGRLNGGAGILFAKNFKLGRVAAKIWQDMQGWNDCG